MTRKQLYAQALSAWIARSLESEADIGREGLPDIDIDHFFRALARNPSFDQSRYSIALAGFGVEPAELTAKATRAGLGNVRALSDDLTTAASWRNRPKGHPRVIALARGWHPGISTLRHYEPAKSRDLAHALIEWFKQQDLVKMSSAQQRLLDALTRDSLSTLVSLDNLVEFLYVWIDSAKANAADAPRRALPELGLLSDPKLFEHSVEERLLANLSLVQRIVQATTSQIRSLQSRTEKLPKSRRQELLPILGRMQAVRLDPTADLLRQLTVEEVLRLLKPPKEKPRDDEDPPETENGSDGSSLTACDIDTQCANALLDNKQEEIEQAADIIETEIADRVEKKETEATGDISFNGSSASFKFAVDLDFLGWLGTFCAEGAWGGLIETTEQTLQSALARYATGKYRVFNPAAILGPDGQRLAMLDLLRAWEEDLAERGIPDLELVRLWNRLGTLRSSILAHLPSLLQVPITILAAKTAFNTEIAEYLSVSAELYRRIQTHYRAMQDCSSSYADLALEGLLACDIVQVKVRLTTGKVSYKAVMLPTHPLHLWRYQRMVALLRGLGPSLTAEDRGAILLECRRPEHFMSVLFVPSIPEGGGAQILPVSNDLFGLATFENLINSYNGLDGAKYLWYAAERFLVLNRSHARPLRLAVLNPPETSQLLPMLTKLLGAPKGLPDVRLHVELFCTSDHANRIQAALSFSGKEREILEEKLANGGLYLRLHEKPVNLEAFLRDLRDTPFHILAVFDEAPVRIRRTSAGMPLPMSPFCVRKTIKYERRENTIALHPRMDDPPFSEFMQLINEVGREQRDNTPHAFADAEGLRRWIDEALQGEYPVARWFFLADRSLPSETGMRSVRMLQKRDGQRQVLLAAANYGALASTIRPALSQLNSNLILSPGELQRLLEEGVHLIGSGLLDLIRKVDGRPDQNRLVGLIGMLLAARHFRREHPNCLIVSVDNDLARLWLSLGKRTERCDLIALFEEGGKLVIEAIEVKASFDERDENMTQTIRHACVQLEATCRAIQQGVPVPGADPSPLAVPRCEMLKEVFVRGCLSRSVPAEFRGVWSGWLTSIFQDPNGPAGVLVRGKVVRILPRKNEKATDRVLHEDPFSIGLKVLTEAHVQALIEERPAQSRSDQSRSSDQAADADSRQNADEVEPAEDRSNSSRGAGILLTDRRAGRRSGETSDRQVPGSDSAGDQWPPKLNALGMVGQADVVAQLLNQIRFSQDFKRRFTDKLFVGSAGVGKSSLARAVAEQLLHQREMFFNGADFRQPRMLVERLIKEGKLPRSGSKPKKVCPCLIFIDEVHGIPPQVATTLLSALDDQRITVIDGTEYDFNDVVFVMATTDPGRLSEAFNSRPDKVYLRDYTLAEVAGIVWLHGKRALDDFSLSLEACMEIAARTRGNPRRAVRLLTNELVSTFHGKLISQGADPDLQKIGELMTAEAIAEHFENKGIDLNGVDNLTSRYLRYLQQNGASSEERLRQALGLTNKSDFVEVDEFLIRLGLVTTPGGRSLTPQGRRYVVQPFDLRDRISRQAG